MAIVSMAIGVTRTTVTIINVLVKGRRANCTCKGLCRYVYLSPTSTVELAKNCLA